MNNLRQAAQQALEALEAEVSESWECNSYHPKIWLAITALKQVLAEPEQPVAFDVQKALQRAYRLGQNYWADADSESYRANKRADKHRQDFEALCAEALAFTAPTPRKPPQFPTMLRKMWSGDQVQEWIDENWNK